MKKVTKLTAVCLLVLSALGVGCTSDGGLRSTSNDRTYEPQAGSTIRDTPQNMSDRVAGREYGKSAVITFAKGSSDLTEAGKTKLRQIVSGLTVDNISRVEIASWSDRGFPMTGNDLSKTDMNLADDRADKINDFLKDETDISSLRIRKYSMAETSNWLARMFRTDEAELKSVFSKEGETPMMREDFNVIKNEGGPTKAVVVFILK